MASRRSPRGGLRHVNMCRVLARERRGHNRVIALPVLRVYSRKFDDDVLQKLRLIPFPSTVSWFCAERPREHGGPGGD